MSSGIGAPETLIVADDALARPAHRGAGRARMPERTLVVPESLFAEIAVAAGERRRAGRRRDAAARERSAPPTSACCWTTCRIPGNVGSMLRSAAAAGVAQVLLSKHCAFAWSPKVLRAGQGAHFCVDITRTSTCPRGPRDFARPAARSSPRSPPAARPCSRRRSARASRWRSATKAPGCRRRSRHRRRSA